MDLTRLREEHCRVIELERLNKELNNIVKDLIDGKDVKTLWGKFKFIDKTRHLQEIEQRIYENLKGKHKNDVFIYSPILSTGRRARPNIFDEERLIAILKAYWKIWNTRYTREATVADYREFLKASPIVTDFYNSNFPASEFRVLIKQPETPVPFKGEDYGFNLIVPEDFELELLGEKFKIGLIEPDDDEANYFERLYRIEPKYHIFFTKTGENIGNWVPCYNDVVNCDF